MRRLRFNLRNQVKMQLRHILKLPAVDDEPVGREFTYIARG